MRKLMIAAALLSWAVCAIGEPVFSSPNLSGEVSTGHNIAVDMTPDGRFLLFITTGEDIFPGDTDGFPNLVIRDRVANTTELISALRSGGEAASISADGRYVAFEAAEVEVVPGVISQTKQIYLRDRLLAQTRLVTADSLGEPLEAESVMPTVSDDGRYVVFVTEAASILNGEEAPQIVLADMDSGEFSVVSRNRGGTNTIVSNGGSSMPSLSGDGSLVAFEALALLPEVEPDSGHVYLWNRSTDELEVISRTEAGELADRGSYGPRISRDGRFVAFISFAPNITGRPNNECHVVRKNVLTGAIRRVDLTAAGEQIPIGCSSNLSRFPYISSTGRYLAFQVDESLIPGLTGPTGAITYTYVRDMTVDRSVLAGMDREGRPKRGYGPVTEDGRFMIMSANGAMYPPELVVPNKEGPLTVGDVFLQDLSPIDMSISAEQLDSDSPVVDIVLENHSALQATLMRVSFTSDEPVLISDLDEVGCPESSVGVLSFDCYIPIVPGGEQRVFRLFFTMEQDEVNVHVSLDVNERDENLANNESVVTITAAEPPPPPPPPPPPSGGGGGGGGLPLESVVCLILLAVSRDPRIARLRYG